MTIAGSVQAGVINPLGIAVITITTAISLPIGILIGRTIAHIVRGY